MDTPVVVESPRSPVTLLGGGWVDSATLDTALAIAPVLVAADGGADAALAAGHVPRAVIGDLDSLSAEARARLDPGTILQIAEQDSTDFEKCLSRIAAPLVLGLGFLGRRFDHSLAALSVLARSGPAPCVLVGAEDVVLHLPPRIELDLPAGSRVSLFPMRAVTGRSRGLEWPIDGLELAPWGRIGTSNRATGPVVVERDGPGLVAILPRAALGAVLAGLSAA